MKIFVITGGIIGIPTLQELIKANLVCGIGVPAEPNQYIQQIVQMGKQASLPTIQLQKKTLKRTLTQVIDQQKPAIVLVLTFPYKIPSQVLNLPKFGFLNYHCAKLPNYRGPHPNFWEIKNKEAYSAITVHQMDKDFDTGPIVYEEKVRIEPQFTHGMLIIKHSYMAIKATQMVLMQLQTGKLITKPQSTQGATYYPAPIWRDLVIDWTKPSSDIKALIRAANPGYQGAITSILGMTLRVYACSGTNVTNEDQKPAGTILTLNATDGLCVACINGSALRLDILALEEGIFLGQNLGKIGLEVGQQFQIAQPSLR
ncbi:MAG: methionyl-tRNA formyltransferase [Flammeovirgaceae bacterium]